MKQIKTISGIFTCMFALVMAVSCSKIVPEGEPSEARRVLIMYADGYNNLTSDLQRNIASLCENAPSVAFSNRYKLLVYSHYTAKSNDYHIPTSPVLLDVYKDMNGNVVNDTVKIYPCGVNSSSAAQLRTVLTDIRDAFPAAEYGFLYSSHGTGWLPQRYYYDKNTRKLPYFFATQSASSSAANPFLEGTPLVRSIGCSGYYDAAGELKTREIEIQDLSGAFPMHFKYIIMDACLMGGVETMYQLRGVTDYFISSCEEIYSSGMDYAKMLDELFYKEKSDLVAVCEDYNQMYKDRSFTISLVQTSQLEKLSDECRYLFDKYRTQIDNLDASAVQVYFRSTEQGPRHWFYDLEDILVKSGLSDRDREALTDALNGCVLYKAASPMGISSEFRINTHCGMSMYLPNKGDAELDGYYRTLDWNIATSLVK